MVEISLSCRSLTIMGNDLLEGSKLWELLRNFEIKVLENMQGSSSTEKQSQIALIRECFDREVVVICWCAGS